VIFVSPLCPHCARTVRSAYDAALASPLVTVHVVDATRFPDLAERYRIRSVPVTIVDGGGGVHGPVSGPELEEMLRTRGTPERETASFASLVEAGRFGDIADRVLEGDGVRWFAAVWRDSTLQLRMGLLVAAEEILAREPRALDAVVEAVLPSLEDEEPGPRGDTADLLARIAHPGATAALRARADDPHPDVAEAVAEALAAIAGRPAS
jgi:thioredoxin-like negative regulator of GroEL